MCIIHFVDGVILGWFIATDVRDARRKAKAIGAWELAARLSEIEWMRPGKFDIAPGFIALVD